MAVAFDMNPNWRVYDVLLNAGVSGDLDSSRWKFFYAQQNEGVRLWYTNRSGVDNLGPDRREWTAGDGTPAISACEHHLAAQPPLLTLVQTTSRITDILPSLSKLLMENRPPR